LTGPFRVALTFDAEHPDRPHHRVGSEDAIRETLGRLGVRATFFVQGRWAEAFPDRARRIAADGHLIGNHSHYHARLPLLTDAGLRDDIRTAEGVIEQACGRSPLPWFRSPFGVGSRDPRVRDVIADLGYVQVLWNATGSDWEPWRTAREVEDLLVASTLAAGDGAVVLSHTWPSHTHGALAGAIKRLRRAGAEFVTVDALDRATLPDTLDV
jgi:peptidoglycan/xylan/chitin deacetylase (PgdA/CDA1 family)